MLKKYFLIFILFIFSSNVFSQNIEHNCHDDNKVMQMQMEKKDCDCCEDETMDNKISNSNSNNCDCDNCDLTQSFFTSNIQGFKDNKYTNSIVFYNNSSQKNFPNK